MIGGGDTGADCVGTAHRQKALSVLQLEFTAQAAGHALAEHALAAMAIAVAHGKLARGRRGSRLGNRDYEIHAATNTAT